MSLLSNILEVGRAWGAPRPARHRGKPTQFSLCCEVHAEPASPDTWAKLPCSAPRPMIEFWQHARSARLFVDATHGQWGLDVLSPDDVARETGDFSRSRPGDHRAGDLVVGRFVGDSDRLLVRCNEAADDYGQVIVLTAADPRNDWYRTGLDLEQFAARYIAAEGEKFWESRASVLPPK